MRALIYIALLLCALPLKADRRGLLVAKTAAGAGGGGGCSTSYANSGGTGDRTGIITTTDSGIVIGGFPDPSALIDGVTGSSSSWFQAAALDSSVFIQWDFGSGNDKVIDEAKFYQSDGTAQGTWKFQGSADAMSWSDIGSSFALGGAATQTITAMSANTTAYRYYRIVGVSGSSSSGPFVYEFEFKLCEP